MDAPQHSEHGLRIIDYALSVVAGLLAVLVTIVGAITKVIWDKVEKLETDRPAAAVTAERIGTLANNIEKLTNQQSSNHIENTTFARDQAEKTAHWRDEIMAPIIRKLTDDSIRHELRIEHLEKSMTSRRERDER